MSDHHDRDDEKESPGRQGRRGFLTSTGVAIGAGLVASRIAGCGSEDEGGGSGGAGSSSGASTGTGEGEGGAGAFPHVAPGQLDDYYGFWSGGQSGEIRIHGVPSMREIKRIPVFNADAATGHGYTDFTKELLKGKKTGDTHHVHLSYDNGTYDGRYVFVNDKAQARLGRVRIDTMECDAIADIPHGHGTHGIFPQRHHTGLVLCNSEFRAPIPNDGSNMDDPSQYAAMHTAIDGETMEVKWQVMVESNMDLCATDYQGKYSFATCYNSENAVHLEEMMGADRDFLYVFNLENIQRAIDNNENITHIGDSQVPVIDARGDNGPYVLRIPIPKSPHGVNIDPTGRYAVCSGKLSPTCSVVDIEKIAQAFAGDIEPRDCVVAEPEVGLGPLHTAFDGRGNAYTSIFIDSVVTKWNIEKAIQKFGGQDDIDPIIQKIDVHYQIGHINASMSETKDADGKWVIALCKFSKDRFLNVGPHHPENDQLIDISGDEMRLVIDEPTFSEPHDAVVVTKDLIHPTKIQPRHGPRFDLYNQWAQEDGINLMQDNRLVRKADDAVRVYLTSQAPNFLTKEFTVKQGDRVTVVLTNIDNVEDLTHGFCMTHHDVNFMVNCQDTNSQTFTADRVGLFWYYCPWFCHALHLEMRGRMIVEPR